VTGLQSYCDQVFSVGNEPNRLPLDCRPPSAPSYMHGPDQPKLGPQLCAIFLLSRRDGRKLRSLAALQSQAVSYARGKPSLAKGAVKSTARYAAFTVLAHAAAVFWHLVLVTKITPGLRGDQVLAATAAITLVPLLALVLPWADFQRLGGLLLFLPLAVGLGIGGDEHFVTPGPLNVFYVAATQWALQFRVTAVLLLVLEVLGCWIALRAFRGLPFSKPEPGQAWLPMNALCNQVCSGTQVAGTAHQSLLGFFAA
jgi:hypothetical protein